MAFILKRTSQIANDGIKIALTGDSGAGKTFQTASLTRPLVLSSENGLLSIKAFDIPYVEITTIDELMEARKQLTAPDVWDSFDTLVIDSISDIAERCLMEYKKTNKNAMHAYLQMMDKVMEALIDICDIKGKDLVCIFKLGRIEDPDTGKVSYAPQTPSDKFASKMPYLFDEVLVLRSQIDAEGNIQRYIQTINDGRYMAKDRSGCLMPSEPADLGAIIDKIKGVLGYGEDDHSTDNNN